MQSFTGKRSCNRAFLMAVEISTTVAPMDARKSLAELGMLADTAGLEVVGCDYQRVAVPDPNLLMGRGKGTDVAAKLSSLGAGVIIFDDELSPRHLRGLEKLFGDEIQVIDRTTLILEIFARHAHTRESMLQIELAQRQYRLPRLTRQWTHLARQAGGSAGRGGIGGVGLRGPGETQLETDRQEIRQQVTRLKRELEHVRFQRGQRRSRRSRKGIPSVALVGYTNAGKSTLLNRLTGAKVFTANRLFATLDPTTRRFVLPDSQVIVLSDTVGFIQKLPHDLIAAFRATLEEVAAADGIVHVVDASHPEAVSQIAVVKSTLRNDLGIKDVPVLLALNKIDKLTLEERGPAIEALQRLYPDSVAISAVSGSGIEELACRVCSMLQWRRVHVKVVLPYTRQDLVSRFYAFGHVQTVQHGATAVEIDGFLERQVVHEYLDFIVNHQG